MIREPIPGRECGSCNVCCVALTIDDPELQKVQGYRCRHANPDNRCGIYADRPETCRKFYCGWRLLKWVRPNLRPNESGVLIRLSVERDGELGVIVSLLTRAALKADGLAETIAAAVNAKVHVYLNVPGPPGYTAAQARIDEALSGPVAARDKAAVLKILRDALREGKAGTTVPIRLTPRALPAPSAG